MPTLLDGARRTSPCPECGRGMRATNMARHRALHVEVMERACRKCGKVKPIDAFVRRTGLVAGREYTCHDCHRKRGQKWEKATGWNRATWARGHYRANKAELDRYAQDWRDANAEKVEEYRRRAVAKRRADPLLNRLWNEHTRRYMALRRKSPEGVSTRLLWQLVEDAVPPGTPPDVRSEAVQDLFLAVLSRELRRIDFQRRPKLVKRVIGRVYEQFANRFDGALSLDAPMGEDSTLTLADLLDEEDALW